MVQAEARSPARLDDEGAACAILPREQAEDGGLSRDDQTEARLRRVPPLIHRALAASLAFALVTLTHGPLLAQSAAASDPVVSTRSAPLLVTRTATRTLRDGKEIVTRRTYRVTFRRDGTGFVAEGVQTSSEIEAPPVLAALARIERDRPDNAIFPAQLDANGLIVEAAATEPGPELAAGIAAARKLVVPVQLSGADRAMANAVLDAAAKGHPAPWPADLFSASAADQTLQRSVALPSGSPGLVTVTQRIPARRSDGTPARYVREVVTEIDGNSRPNREEWSIVDAPE
jgi:hypothetical protein